MSTVFCLLAAGSPVDGAPAAAPAPAETAAASVRHTLYGTSGFPYARSDEAAQKTLQVARDLGDLYVVQLDDGVPWAEALEDKPFPTATDRKWRNLLANAPAGKPVYLALEPLASDRVTLAPPSEGSSLPAALRGAPYDADAMVRSYLTYARRAIRYFKPAFVNLGVENGELAHRDPARWPAYSRLVKSVMGSLRAEFPGVPLGISFGLQSLMEPDTAGRAKELVEASDYLGLSFYPYMSNFHEKFHLRPLPAPPQEWRVPLDWLRSYTSKPIAICETGYNTANVELAQPAIHLRGDAQTQAAYVRDLADYAARDRYLFVVYYLPIDIGPMLSTLPKAESTAASMWRENGLFDASLQPKPALGPWRQVLAQRYEAPPAAAGSGPPRAAAAVRAQAPSAGRSEGRPAGTVLGFSQDGDLCQSPPPAQTDIDGAGTSSSAMRWQYQRRRGTWAWCARKFQSGAFPRGAGMSLRVRSDRDLQLILQLKEANGTAHFAAIPAGPAWRDVALGWDEFRLDEHTGSDRRVHPENIVEVLVADEGKDAPGSGEKSSVWMSQWQVR